MSIFSRSLWKRRYRRVELRKLPLNLENKLEIPNYISKNFVTPKKFNKTKFYQKITIKITSNNIFCTLADLKTKKVVLAGSGGRYKIKTSKKRLKYTHRRILIIFFSKIWKYLNMGGIMIFVTAPIRLRKKIISLLFKLRVYKLKSKKTRHYRAIFIKLKNKKCFNGCRSKKKRRKKRKGLRLIK